MKRSPRCSAPAHAPVLVGLAATTLAPLAPIHIADAPAPASPALPLDAPPVKRRVLEGFGTRLAELRQARGLTQGELGALAGVAYRVIAYYERDDAQPPGAMLVDLARALRISTDELLGVTPVSDTPSPKVARLLKRIERLAELPDAEQRAVLKVVEGFLDSYSPAKPRRRAAPPPRPKRKAS